MLVRLKISGLALGSLKIAVHLGAQEMCGGVYRVHGTLMFFEKLSCRVVGFLPVRACQDLPSRSQTTQAVKRTDAPVYCYLNEVRRLGHKG